MPWCFTYPEGGGWPIGVHWCSWEEWWNQFSKGAADTIRWTIQGILDAIEAIKKALATAMYYFQKWIVSYLNSDLNILIMAADVIIAVVCVAVIGPVISGLPFVLKIKAALAAMKVAVGTFLSKIHLDEIHAMSHMLEVLWPEYRSLVHTFENALAGLSEQLGYGTGMIVAMMSGIRAIIHSSYTILGWDANTKEVAWFDAADALFKKIDQNFYRYAYDPGQMMDDVIEDIVLPVSQTATEAQIGLMGDIQSLDDRAKVITDELVNITQSIDGIVEALPEDMTAFFRQEWEPVKHEFLSAIDEFKNGVLDSLDQALKVWKDYSEDQDKINARLMNEANDPLRLAKKVSEMSEPDRYLFGDTLGKLIDSRDRKLSDERAAALLPAAEQVERSMEAIRLSLPTKKVLAFEKPGVSWSGLGSFPARSSWYVGEY